MRGSKSQLKQGGVRAESGQARHLEEEFFFFLREHDVLQFWHCPSQTASNLRHCERGWIWGGGEGALYYCYLRLPTLKESTEVITECSGTHGRAIRFYNKLRMDSSSEKFFSAFLEMRLREQADRTKVWPTWTHSQLTGKTSGSSLHICKNRSGRAEECSGPCKQIWG